MSRRSASVLQSTQGLMWLARRSSGTSRPVIAQRPSQYSNKPQTEDVLTDPLDHQAFGFRRPRQIRYLVLEDLEQRVRQGARELECAAQQAMECGDVADTRRTASAAREQVGEHHAEIIQTFEDVGPRHGSEKPGFSPAREPDSHRCLTAAEGEPVGRVLQFEIEAVVRRGFLQTGDRDRRSASAASAQRLSQPRDADAHELREADPFRGAGRHGPRGRFWSRSCS